MKWLGDAQKRLALLQWRTLVLRQQVRRERDALERLDAKLAENRETVQRLNERLAEIVPPKSYARSELMRARGRQAVVRLDIARKKMDEADLLELRNKAEHRLHASQHEWVALERRQNKHRDRLVRRKYEHDLRRESLGDAEIMEGRSHDVGK